METGRYHGASNLLAGRFHHASDLYLQRQSQRKKQRGRGERAEEEVDIEGENSLVGQGRRPRLPRHQKSTPQPPNPQPQGWGVDPAYSGGWDESYSGEGEISQDNFAPADLTGRAPTPQEFVDLWNQVCADLPKVNTLSDSRARKIRLRLEQQSIDYWRTVFERMNRTPFLNGEGDLKPEPG